MAKSNKNSIAKQEEVSKFSPDQVKEFLGEVKSEFNKIAWPDKKHTVGTTAVVTVLVFIISFYLGAVDLVVGKLIGALLK